MAPSARTRWKTAAASLLAILTFPTGSGVAVAQTSSPPSVRPNVLVISIDDAAFMDLGTYGGEARTPNIDRLAGRGALLASHHTSPLCSPSRAMLLTGVDNHRTGVATIEEVLPPEHVGKPGYSLRLEPGVKTVATRLKAAGYRTYMTGKWHLGHGPGDLPDAHGFDRSLALDASGADNWAPKPYMPYYHDGAVVRGRQAGEHAGGVLLVRAAGRQDDRATSAPTRKGPSPSSRIVAFQAVHIPVQAPAEYTARYEGRVRRWLGEAAPRSLGARDGASA